MCIVHLVTKQTPPHILMNALDRHLNSAFKHVVQYGPKFTPTCVPYCSVDACGRPTSKTEWIARMDTAKDDFNLCFFGTKIQTPDEWRKTLGWTWTPSSDIGGSRLWRGETTPTNLYGFMCLYEPWLTQKLGNEPELRLPDPKGPVSLLDVDLISAWTDVVANYRVFYELFSFVADNAEIVSSVASAKETMKTLTPESFGVDDQTKMIREMGAFMQLVVKYLSEAHAALLRPNPNHSTKRTKSEGATAYEEMRNKNQELNDHFYHIKPNTKSFLELKAEKERMNAVEAARITEATRVYEERKDEYRRRVHDKSTLVEAIRHAVMRYMRDPSCQVQYVQPPPTQRERVPDAGFDAALRKLFLNELVKETHVKRSILDNDALPVRVVDDGIEVLGVSIILGLVFPSDVHTMGDAFRIFRGALLETIPPGTSMSEAIAMIDALPILDAAPVTSSSSSEEEEESSSFEEGEEEEVVPSPASLPIFVNPIKSNTLMQYVKNNRVPDNADEIAVHVLQTQGEEDELLRANALENTRSRLGVVRKEKTDGVDAVPTGAVDEDEDDAMFMPRFVSVRR